MPFVFISGINSLTKIKDQLPDYVEYNHIKVVIAVLVQKHGQERSKNDDIVLCGSGSFNQEVVDIDISGDQKLEFSPPVVSTIYNSQKCSFYLFLLVHIHISARLFRETSTLLVHTWSLH